MDHSPLIDHSCGFCVEIHGMDTDNNLFKRVIAPETGLKSRYVYEDDTFVVMPTLGAFVEGYVMIVSKEHYDCVGKMSAEDIARLEALMEEITHRIRKVYGMDVICFEHGAVSCANKFGGCLNHAHVHLVPCNASLLEEIRDYDLEVEPLSSLSELQSLGQEGRPYLFFRDTDGEQYLITGDFIVSQFFRQLVTARMGLDQKWDWREHMFLDNVFKTVKGLTQDEANE